MANFVIELEITFHDFLEHVRLVVSVEWELAVEHGVKDNSTAPRIDLRTVIGHMLKDLRSGIVGGST